ncbi:hypothetical protein MYOV003v1_p0008 [Vibrio phage 207E48.1]|nr:hypothetical protein MYOV003v1_p0008 [Vibrio phage 207E48.1]
MKANTYQLTATNHGAHFAVRLITMDGNAPEGTISDIREVTGDTIEAALVKVWKWFVKDERLVLKSGTGDVIAYRGEKTFVKAAANELGVQKEVKAPSNSHTEVAGGSGDHFKPVRVDIIEKPVKEPAYNPMMAGHLGYAYDYNLTAEGAALVGGKVNGSLTPRWHPKFSQIASDNAEKLFSVDGEAFVIHSMQSYVFLKPEHYVQTGRTYMFAHLAQPKGVCGLHYTVVADGEPVGTYRQKKRAVKALKAAKAAVVTLKEWEK